MSDVGLSRSRGGRQVVWALRLLGSLIFFGYLTYFLVEIVTDPHSLVSRGSLAEVNARNALLGLVVLGLPALYLAVRGCGERVESDSILREPLDEPSGPRFEQALEALRSGGSFNYRGIDVSRTDEGLEFGVESSWSTAEATESRALEDFAAARKTIDELLDRSPALREIARRHRPTLVLVYDYGSGAVELCRQGPDGAIVWAPGFPQR